MQFPTPYPGELWYSIIARYHKRSGNPFWYMSIQELFDGRTNSTLITGFYPNESIIMVHDKFPNVIDLRKAVLESTLLPYLMRFYPKEKKIQAFEDFINGVNTKPRLYRYTKHDKLRYCPLCRQEEIEKYGSPTGIPFIRLNLCLFVRFIAVAYVKSQPTSRYSVGAIHLCLRMTNRCSIVPITSRH